MFNNDPGPEVTPRSNVVTITDVHALGDDKGQSRTGSHETSELHHICLITNASVR